MLYELNLSHNTTKDIYYAKGEESVDHSNQMIEEILLELQKPQCSGKVR